MLRTPHLSPGLLLHLSPLRLYLFVAPFTQLPAGASRLVRVYSQKGSKPASQSRARLPSHPLSESQARLDVTINPHNNTTPLSSLPHFPITSTTTYLPPFPHLHLSPLPLPPQSLSRRLSRRRRRRPFHLSRPLRLSSSSLGPLGTPSGIIPRRSRSNRLLFGRRNRRCRCVGVPLSSGALAPQGGG